MRKFMNGMNHIYIFQVEGKTEACAYSVVKNEIDGSLPPSGSLPLTLHAYEPTYTSTLYPYI
jgi:hypothetical protein